MSVIGVWNSCLLHTRSPKLVSKKRVNGFIESSNTSILEEEEYVELVHVFIKEMSQHPSRIETVDQWWENTFKPGLMRLSIKYCKKRILLLRNDLGIQLYNFDRAVEIILNSCSGKWISFFNLQLFSKNKDFNLSDQPLGGFEQKNRCPTFCAAYCTIWRFVTRQSRT